MASKKRPRNFTNEDKRPQNKSQSSRRSNRSNNRFTKGKDDKVMEKKPGGNDPRWWGSEDYVNTVARFNFASPLGKAVPFSFNNTSNSVTTWKMATDHYLETIPGIMSIDVLPTLGHALDPTDPVNCYLRNVYSKLRSTNNQNAPYAAPDLGMYLLAIDSVHMIIEQLERMYGIARTYSPMNRYMPEALLYAMGVDPNASEFPLYKNLADFRAEIINLQIKVQTLAIPKGISFNDRHRELVRYVYKDGESVKAQMYVFRTSYLYKFNETYNQNGGGLEATAVPFGQSVLQWIILANALIDAITQSESMNIVSGDIIKSFGYENLYGMPFFEETYTVVPVFNPEILLEIHNLKVAGDRFESNAFDVTQDAGMNSIMMTPYCTTSKVPAGPINCVIDVPLDDPSPDTVMCATRLAVSGYGGWIASASKYKFTPDSFGTELVTNLCIWYWRTSGTIGYVNSDTNTFGTVNTYATFPMRESFFDWHPHIYYLTDDSTHAAAELHSIVSDLMNYTVMDMGDLRKLHEMAVWGALTMILVENTGLNKK